MHVVDLLDLSLRSGGHHISMDQVVLSWGELGIALLARPP